MLPRLSDRVATFSPSSIRSSHSPTSPVPPKKRPIMLTLETQSTEDISHRAAISPHAILKGMRERNKEDKEAITPETAAKVVADYILPMFEADTRGKTNADRKSVFNLQKISPRGSTPGTVYHELKLSEQLASELDQLKNVLKGQTNRLKEVEQARESAQTDLERLREEFTQLQASYHLVKTHLTIAVKESEENVQSLGMVADQLAMYKRMYEVCEADKKTLMSTLHEEKGLSDKLRNRATELEQGNSLLKMENDIMGERLKGLYSAIFHLSDRQSIEDKLGGEVHILALALRNLIDYEQQTVDELKKTLDEKDVFRLEFTEMAKLRQELKVEKDRILLITREKVNTLSTELAAVKDELDKAKTNESKLEKRFKDLEEEHTRMRQKLKQNRLKRKQYGESELKVCRWCQKEYSELENFNWSCRTHKGDFGDHMYWCCGKTAKDALGCQVKKHESKEDDDLLEGKEREEMEQLRLLSTHCSVTHYSELQRNRPSSYRMSERPEYAVAI